MHFGGHAGMARARMIIGQGLQCRPVLRIAIQDAVEPHQSLAWPAQTQIGRADLMTQAQIARLTGVSEVTIRKHYRLLKDFLLTKDNPSEAA